MKSIAVVIPAYKCEQHILDVIDKIPEMVEFIVVVNDSSPDATLERVLSHSDPRLHVISHTKNQGVGGAMLSGYSYALSLGAEIVVKVDGDDQMDGGYLPLLVSVVESGYADYAKGNRFIHASELRRMPFFRMIGNFFLSFMTKMASGYWSIFDPTNGFTAISRDALANLDPYRIRKDYFFETSMLCELRTLDVLIRDVPIPARYADEKSSLSPSKEVFNFSVNLLLRTVRRFYVQYFLYNFTAVSAFLLFGGILGIFGVIWGARAWVISGETGIPATTGTVLIAALAIILAAQFIIQALALDVSATPNGNYWRMIPSSIDIPGPRYMIDYFKQELKRGDIKLERGSNQTP